MMIIKIEEVISWTCFKHVYLLLHRSIVQLQCKRSWYPGPLV